MFIGLLSKSGDQNIVMPFKYSATCNEMLFVVAVVIVVDVFVIIVVAVCHDSFHFLSEKKNQPGIFPFVERTTLWKQ